MITRRALALGSVAVGRPRGDRRARAPLARQRAKAATEGFEVVRTPEEWRKLLTPEQYAVLREEDTERPFTSPLNHEKRKGTFTCAGCDLPLFASETKFDSGTGWPSFYAPIEGAVEDRQAIGRSAWSGKRCIAAAAAAISATSSTTARSPPACAIASTACR